MTQYQKLVLKFLERPESISFGELLKILKKNGFLYYGGKGSHQVYKNETGITLVLPLHNNEVKAVYKKQAKNIIFPNSHETSKNVFAQ